MDDRGLSSSAMLSFAMSKEHRTVRLWKPEQLLRLMRPRDREWHNIYVIGCYDHRVTFYNQQVRALCLVAALAETNQIKNRRIAIIGGGAAGCTAALAACRAGATHVTLFERRRILHLQAMSNRLLHPHIYDWPAPISREPLAGLPFLNWEANEAKIVVARLRSEISHVNLEIRDEGTGSNHVAGVHPVGDKVEILLDPVDNDIFDLALISVGFGSDEPRDIKAHNPAYWENDSLETMEGKKILISGAGDGGLIDLARACLSEFRHEALLDLLLEVGVSRDLENTFGNEGKSFTECVQAVAGMTGLADKVRERASGRNNTVYFNCPTRGVFHSVSAPINRLLAVLLFSSKAIELVPGNVSIERGTDGFIASIDDAQTGRTRDHVVDHVVARHGPWYRDKNGKRHRYIEHALPRLAAVCRDMGGTLADLRINEVLDHETYDFFASNRAIVQGAEPSTTLVHDEITTSTEASTNKENSVLSGSALHAANASVRLAAPEVEVAHIGHAGLAAHNQMQQDADMATLRAPQGTTITNDPVFAWIHIADLYSGAPVGDFLDLRVAKRALIRDLKTCPFKLERIFVTGDASFAGWAWGVDEAVTWVRDLATAAGLPISALRFVPGNHDVDRRVSPERVLRRIYSAIRESTEEFDRDLTDNDMVELLLRKMGRYRDFVQYAAPEHPEHLHMVDWSEALAPIPGVRGPIRIAGLCTVLTSNDEDAAGRMVVGRRQLEAVLGNAKDEEIVLLLSHHSLAWLHPTCRDWVRSYLADQVHVLHSSAGHAHESASTITQMDNGVHVLSGLGSQDYGYLWGAIRWSEQRKWEVGLAPRIFQVNQGRMCPDHRYDLDDRGFLWHPINLPWPSPDWPEVSGL